MHGPLAGIDRFPRARLGHAPTPLDPAPGFGAALGVELWIKRDDCTGLAFGGNKVRQLEFHFGEAQARGADTVLVTGAVQSNLVRLAAAGARRLGMDAHVQLEERVDGAGALYRRGCARTRRSTTSCGPSCCTSAADTRCGKRWFGPDRRIWRTCPTWRC